MSQAAEYRSAGHVDGPIEALESEQALIGSLVRGRYVAEIRAVMPAALCYRHDHRFTAEAAYALSDRGVTPDPKLIADDLKDVIDNVPYLYQVAEHSLGLTPDKIVEHGRRIRAAAASRYLVEKFNDASRTLREHPGRIFDTIPRQIADALAEIQAGSGRTLSGLDAVELQAHTFEYRRPLLKRDDSVILREGNLAEVFAPRGVGKTWFKRTVAHLVANPGVRALGFHSDEPARVLDVDGEMASTEIQERDATLMQALGVGPSPNLVTVAADWQDEYLPRLDTAAGQAAIEPFVAAADLIILDNRSCLFDPEGEKDPTAWQPAQDWLLSLRRRRKAVLVVHHSNRQGGARGHSKPEDCMDLLFKLTRPEGYVADQGARFTFEFEKSRGVHGSALTPFTAVLRSDGWHVEDSTNEETGAAKKLRDYLHLAHKADDRPRSANDAISKAKVGRNSGLAAWAAMKTEGAIRQHPDGGFYLG